MVSLAGYPCVSFALGLLNFCLALVFQVWSRFVQYILCSFFHWFLYYVGSLALHWLWRCFMNAHSLFSKSLFSACGSSFLFPFDFLLDYIVSSWLLSSLLFSFFGIFFLIFRIFGIALVSRLIFLYRKSYCFQKFFRWPTSCGSCFLFRFGLALSARYYEGCFCSLAVFFSYIQFCLHFVATTFSFWPSSCIFFPMLIYKNDCSKKWSLCSFLNVFIRWFVFVRVLPLILTIV